MMGGRITSILRILSKEFISCRVLGRILPFRRTFGLFFWNDGGQEKKGWRVRCIMDWLLWFEGS